MDMIVCPNCNHQNPDGAVQCEACYTPLPALMICPNCGASIQADASFCGQCGFNLRTAATQAASEVPPEATLAPDFDIPDLVAPEPLVAPDPLTGNVRLSEESVEALPIQPAPPVPPPPDEHSPVVPSSEPATVTPSPQTVPAMAQPASAGGMAKTQLQIQTAKLLHVQTNTILELPQHLAVIHIGKQNDRIPPDIDVSGFPNSEIVSRIHADIRVEGDTYYVEDVGSSNGTYINNMVLPMGDRHRLRPGDRIALGKGDKVTFLFQLS
jgi:pSer/pThr/pTyr-binding forkhead associated (FHA) protein/ribosomal protein L40E